MLVLRLQVYIRMEHLYIYIYRCQENKNTSDEKRHKNNDIQHECSLHYSVMLAHTILSAAIERMRENDFPCMRKSDWFV